jgi:hypothetical protein
MNFSSMMFGAIEYKGEGVLQEVLVLPVHCNFRQLQAENKIATTNYFTNKTANDIIEKKNLTIC